MQHIVAKSCRTELVSVFGFLQNLQATDESIRELLKGNHLNKTTFKLILAFARGLDKVSYKLEYLNYDMATRVLWLIFKTHFSNNENLWHPLFKEKAGYSPKLVGRCESEDIIWDQIIPPVALLIIQLKSTLPSHAGGLPERIPDVFIEAD